MNNRQSDFRDDQRREQPKRSPDGDDASTESRTDHKMDGGGEQGLTVSFSPAAPPFLSIVIPPAFAVFVLPFIVYLVSLIEWPPLFWGVSLGVAFMVGGVLYKTLGWWTATSVVTVEGDRVECTLDHPVLWTRTTWIPSDELRDVDVRPSAYKANNNRVYTLSLVHEPAASQGGTSSGPGAEPDEIWVGMFTNRDEAEGIADRILAAARTGETGDDDGSEQGREATSSEADARGADADRFPVSDGIRREERPGRGRQFSFAPARAKGPATLLSITAAGLAAGTGGLLHYLFSPGILLGLLRQPIGGTLGVFFLLLLNLLFLYVAWITWTRATTVLVDDGAVAITNGPFGIGPTRRLPCSSLERVFVRRSQFPTIGGWGIRSETYYAVMMRFDSAAAEGEQSLVRRFARWFMNLVFGDGAGDRFVKRFGVAGWLTNEREADWIAEQLEAAAEREAAAS